MSGGEDSLPSGWLQVSLGEIVDSITYGYTESATWDEVGPRFLRITDLQNGRVDWGSVPFCRCSDEEKYRLKSGDIVVARTGATTGKSFLLVDPPASCVFASYLIRLETNHNVSAAYLAEYLRSPAYWLQITEVKKGSAQPGVNASVLGGLDVPVPPLNEQKRIVAKIEALQARSDAAREALDAIPPLLEKFRQSVLAAAFRGDLTKAWREANPDVEPASELLERIRAERRRRWEEANPKKKYVEPEPVDTEGLPELPEGWCWASLEEVIHESRTGLVRSALAQSAVQTANALPYLRMQHYGLDGQFRLDQMTYVEVDEQERAAFSLRAGDILFNTRNSYELVGKVAVWPAGMPAHIFNNNIRVLRTESGVSERWVGGQMQSPLFRSLIASAKSATTSICAIYTSDLLRQPIALAPMEEQTIVLRVYNALAGSHLTLTGCLNSLDAEWRTMDQSILAKAFRGELVPQDPNDEPASVLLERIRQERAAAVGDGAVRRGRRKKGE